MTSLVPEIVVGNDVWPSDVDDVSEASVDKGLQLVVLGDLYKETAWLEGWGRLMLDLFTLTSVHKS